MSCDYWPLQTWPLPLLDKRLLCTRHLSDVIHDHLFFSFSRSGEKKNHTLRLLLPYWISIIDFEGIGFKKKEEECSAYLTCLKKRETHQLVGLLAPSVLPPLSFLPMDHERLEQKRLYHRGIHILNDEFIKAAMKDYFFRDDRHDFVGDPFNP